MPGCGILRYQAAASSSRANAVCPGVADRSRARIHSRPFFPPGASVILSKLPSSSTSSIRRPSAFRVRLQDELARFTRNDAEPCIATHRCLPSNSFRIRSKAFRRDSTRMGELSPPAGLGRVRSPFQRRHPCFNILDLDGFGRVTEHAIDCPHPD